MSDFWEEVAARTCKELHVQEIPVNPSLANLRKVTPEMPEFAIDYSNKALESGILRIPVLQPEVLLPIEERFIDIRKREIEVESFAPFVRAKVKYKKLNVMQINQEFGIVHFNPNDEQYPITSVLHRRELRLVYQGQWRCMKDRQAWKTEREKTMKLYRSKEYTDIVLDYMKYRKMVEGSFEVANYTKKLQEFEEILLVYQSYAELLHTFKIINDTHFECWQKDLQTLLSYYQKLDAYYVTHNIHAEATEPTKQHKQTSEAEMEYEFYKKMFYMHRKIQVKLMGRTYYVVNGQTYPNFGEWWVLRQLAPESRTQESKRILQKALISFAKREIFPQKVIKVALNNPNFMNLHDELKGEM